MGTQRNQYKFQVLTGKNWAKEVSYFFLGRRTNTWNDFLKEGWRENSNQPVQDVFVSDDADTPVAAILQNVEERTLKISYVFFQSCFDEDATEQVDRLTEILKTYLIYAKEVLRGNQIPEFDEVEFMNSVDGVAYFAMGNLANLDPRNSTV